MSYYWFKRQKILQNAKEKYCKGKAAEYYLQNKEAIKKAKERYRNLPQDKNTKLEIIRKRNIRNWFNIKRKH